MSKTPRRIDAFNLREGRALAGKYRIEGLLGTGWEGEVYKVVETKTGIPRAAKIFFPQRNARDRAVTFYAKKLDRLRKCPIVIQYHHSESIRYRGLVLTCLISEFVEGELLCDFVRRQRGRRMQPFEALHLLHALAVGLEQIHAVKEYHGDLHDGNVLVKRIGIGFEVKLVDFFHLGASSTSRLRDDVIDLIRLLYDAVGGKAHYDKQPPEIKAICCGLRHGLILKKFPTVRDLRQYLESFAWTSR